MTAPADEDEWTEAFDADIPRADLVGKAANGTPGFLLMKQDAAGLMDPDTIRTLLKSAEPPERDDITMTGSPAAIAKMIHDAPMRQGNLFASMQTIADTYTPRQAVVKDDPMDSDVEVGDLMGDGGTLAESVPGGADWENLDGDTAMNAIAVLGRIQAVIGWLGDREATEAVTSDPGDAENVWDLEGAGCAVQCAIDTLAAFAAGEKLEASLESELEAVGKAAAPLTVLEGFAPLVKAGRVLSATNEQALRGAAEAIQTVLASLPAPTPDDAAPVAKSDGETVTEDVEKAVDEPTAPTAPATTEQNTPEPADTPDTEDPKTADPAPVAKAKGDPLVVAYNATGVAIGIVDPDDLMPIASDATADTNPAPADEAAPPTDTSDAPATDTTPADPADVGTPSGDVTEAAPPATPDEDVQKSELVKAVDSVKAEFEEKLASRDAAYELLKGEFDAFLQAPARPHVLSNGALPPAHLLRGQQAGGPSADSDRVAELQKLAKGAADPAVRSEAIRELNDGAQAAWKAMLSGQ